MGGCFEPLGRGEVRAEGAAALAFFCLAPSPLGRTGVGNNGGVCNITHYLVDSPTRGVLEGTGTDQEMYVHDSLLYAMTPPIDGKHRDHWSNKMQRIPAMSFTVLLGHWFPLLPCKVRDTWE